MRDVDLSRVWGEISKAQVVPPGGAGGLGIIAETIGWTGARFADDIAFGLVQFSLLHALRREQSLPGMRQKLRFMPTSPEGQEGFLPLGELAEIPFAGETKAVDVWLNTRYARGEKWAPDFRLSLPGTTGILYPSCATQENFDQMHVLGAGGFAVARYFGLLGVDEPVADLVIGHDGHSAVFKFQLFLYFLDKFNRDMGQAVQATRNMCIATIHAPQSGTVPRTNGGMVARHYGSKAEQIYGLFGADSGEMTNGLFVEYNLSGRHGVVSPLHWMVTDAEEKARRRGFAGARLLPENAGVGELELFTDALDAESWLGAATMLVLDEYVPGWRTRPAMLGQAETVDALRFNEGFRRALVAAFEIQEAHLVGLLANHYPMQFRTEIPANAILLASLRRATQYKIQLAINVLERCEIIDAIARSVGRPIYYLFGGIAHQDDTASIDSLEKLLRLVDQINKECEFLRADFLLGHDYEKAKWLFPGLARRGVWVGYSNPLGPGRGQGTEAFGPSYEKMTMSGGLVLGPHDGGAACLEHLPTVHVYGPATFAGSTGFHNDLWGNAANMAVAPTFLMHDFLHGVAIVVRKVAEDLQRFEAGRGWQAPGLGARISAMCQAIAAYNGAALMQAYLGNDRS
jgi:hypothetical protein